MIVIYHNPRCSKSREAVKLVESAGHQPVIVRYLDAGWTRGQLLALLAVADARPVDWLRRKEAAALDTALLDADVDDDTLIAAMVAHPALVERPIVCTPRGVCLCRPPSRVTALLPG